MYNETFGMTKTYMQNSIYIQSLHDLRIMYEIHFHVVMRGLGHIQLIFRFSIFSGAIFGEAGGQYRVNPFLESREDSIESIH